MSYAVRSRLTGSSFAVWTVVALLHVLLGWALVHGLARRVIEVIRMPIETRIIAEVRTPPSPMETLPLPKLAAPPVFIPPPEVRVAKSQATAGAITATPDMPAAAAVAPLAVPARIDVGTCDKPEYPPAALRAEAKGISRIRFVVDANGVLTRADVERPAGPSREHRLLDLAAIGALSKCRFKPGVDEQGRAAGGVTVVEYVWKID